MSDIETGENAPKVVYGKQALETLKQYMNDQSFADLQDLLEKYPGESTVVRGNRKYSESPVIELMCYDRCVGTIPGRNMVIGEVREY